jgi:serine/threonine protein kinase
MAIFPGRRLGPYEILSAIGAGGMGEVYKARDTRLDRIVAIKVLPTHLADRSELRERFEREAKTIASLNHPHICTLYDTGHQDHRISHGRTWQENFTYYPSNFPVSTLGSLSDAM